MASFSYVVIDKKGKESKGAMEAINEEKVNRSLRAAGYIPISIVPQNVFTKDINVSIGNPIKARDLSAFCRQFCSILSAGVSITTSLHMLEEQTEKKVMKQAITSVRENVERGETLADAMRRQGKVFPPILINMVEAGETSGSLEGSLERSAIHFEKEAKLKALMKKAMIYPTVVACVAVLVIIIMLSYVIPKFLTMFSQMNVEMPLPTRMVIAMSEFMQHKWYVVILVVTVVILAIKGFQTLPNGERLFAHMALRIPLFGKLKKKNACARLARTLSTLTRSGISLIDAVEITARTMENVELKQILLNAKEEVARGIPLSLPLKESGIFPPMIYQMISIGEETGNLEDMLDCVADYFEEEVEMGTESLTTILEPLIIVFLALIVGFLVISIMLPMVTVYKGIDSM
ncbi:type II secretion system F family protein [Anaerosporobacter faecicola]|uniref:type II secretion system F family protein n=1 Tax=Anaerosporobacter faecicola TaxID=2718714 RepID=UPI00143962B8|nr:type II secretion system F family protein [Anaerosporobacter faecicola]